MKTAFVYSTDENYAKLTAVSIYSLLQHNPNEAIVLLANEVTPASAKFLTDLVTGHGGTIQIIDVKAELADIKSLGANRYVSYSTYARFYIPNLLKGQFDRAVYIDSDTLVTDSLEGMKTLDLHDQPFAIGYDCIFNNYKKLIGIPPTSPYFNAGVLIMDLAKWQERRCSERIFDYMKNVRHDSILGDQDFFALVLSSDAATLPPQYNFLTHFQMFRRAKDARFAAAIPKECWYSDEAFAAAQTKPAIRHFLGHTLGRPWFKESKNPLRPLFVKLATEAGVPEVAEQSRPIDFCYRVQWLCWKMLPRPLFVLACRAMYRYFFWSAYRV